VIDENYQIPLLFDSYKRYYKLPGWWMEWEEDKIEAFRREIKEETGCEIEDIEEIWKVIEKVANWEQINYCMIWKIVSKWEPHFTDKEIERWYKLIWVSLKEAVSLIKNEETTTDDAKFKQERELYILEKACEELRK
jgi:ADP-ribose pyrophosphatase YjhB (NUDIX family)